MAITTERVDYQNPRHRDDFVMLLDEYARSEMIGGLTLGDEKLSRLPDQLAEFPTAFSLLAYNQETNQAEGLANCFFGFSTFAGRKLVNIHDIMVTERSRGQGIAGKLLAAIEAIAAEHDCCRITLEVLADNAPAKRAYEKFGFDRYDAHRSIDTVFLVKPLLSPA